MLHDRKFYTSLNFNGFTWSYFEEESGLHCFTKKLLTGGFLVMFLDELSLINDNALYMSENGYSISFDKSREFSILLSDHTQYRNGKTWAYKTAFKKLNELKNAGINCVFLQN